MLSKTLLLLGLKALTAAQDCQNYWIGVAPWCEPGSCEDDAHRWWGIRSNSGDGRSCWIGKKRLCQCLASHDPEPCTASTSPNMASELHGLFTVCNNGCTTYICGVKNNVTPTHSLTPDQAHDALWRIDVGVLAHILSTLGVDVSGSGQDDLVAKAWLRFEPKMGELDIGSVDARASFDYFDEGQSSWTYYPSRVY